MPTGALGDPLLVCRRCARPLSTVLTVNPGSATGPSDRGRIQRRCLTSSCPITVFYTRWIDAGRLVEVSSGCEVVLRARDALFVCATRGTSSASALAHVEVTYTSCSRMRCASAARVG